MNICSLLPGATETLALLGLADQVVGVSHECDFPEVMRRKPVLVRAAIDPDVTTSSEVDRLVRQAAEGHRPLYTLDETRLAELSPDLIVTQGLCHVCAITPDQLHGAIKSLPVSPRILSLNPSCIADMVADVMRIAEAAGRPTAGTSLTRRLSDRMDIVRARAADGPSRPRVVCLEWLDPLYVAGHWVPEMIEIAGGHDAFGITGAPSRRITWEQVLEVEPDVVLVMPCGFSLERTRREFELLTARPGWTDMSAVRRDRVYVVDAGAYFSRPGPRLVDGIEALASILHPGLFPPPPPPLSGR